MALEHARPVARPEAGEAKPVEHEKNFALQLAHAQAPATEIPLAVQTFPPEPLDDYVSHTHRAPQFVTSSQCMGCHSASASVPFGPTMWVTPAPRVAATKNGLNVSEYGEWRWSPMGLAGRDPVFFAQLGSELAYLRRSRAPRRTPARRCSSRRSTSA